MAELNDKDLYDSATSDAPVEQAETPVTEQAETGPARDEQGRFAPKVEAQPEQVTTPAEPAPAAKPEEAHVPSWRLREVNDAREAAERRAQEAIDRAQAYERQLQQFQQQAPKPEAPDMFADPQAWQTFVLQQQHQTAHSQRYEFSEMLARQAFGDERVTEAEKWAAQNVGPAERARIANSRHPYAELIKIQDERKVLSEIGTDPNAYVQKKLDEALNNPEFLAKAAERIRTGGQQTPGRPNTIVQLPPSINRATAAGSPHDEAGDFSDGSLYAHATR